MNYHFNPKRDIDGNIIPYELIMLRKDNDEIKKRCDVFIDTPMVGFEGQTLVFMPTAKIGESLKKIHEIYIPIHVSESEAIVASEIFHTCTIEGAKTTIRDTQALISNARTAKNHSEKMIYNSFQATKFMNLVNQGQMISEDNLIAAWNILTDGAMDNESIKGTKYRSGNVAVGNHTAIKHEYVQEFMNVFMNFLHAHHAELGVDPFIKAAMVQYYFVWIHPFCDGNGRLGRLLSTDYLIRSGFDKFKAIPLSKYIADKLQNYYLALQTSENVYQDITFFIEYYLDIILVGLEGEWSKVGA